MAGHSKWANIQHRKGAQDKKRSNMFAKLAKEITVAAKMHGGDLQSNARLRLAVTTARGSLMPKSTIERAIKKGTGDIGSANTYEDIRYEGYGLGGVAILVEVLTDNRNRSFQEVKVAFSKGGGHLGEAGSVSFGFSRKGQIRLDKNSCDSDTLLEKSVDLNVDDIQIDDASYTIVCPVSQLHTTSVALEKLFGTILSTSMVWLPRSVVSLNGELAQKTQNLITNLEKLEDVQNIYTNMAE